MNWLKQTAIRNIEAFITASVLILGAVLTARGLVWLAGEIFK